MYYIGIDLGGTNIAAGIVDENRKIICTDSKPTLSTRHYSEIVKDMADLCSELINKAGLTVSDISGIGIGSPGTIDNKNGVVVYANNLGWYDVPLAAELNKYINVPINIENDANAAAYGEFVECGGDVDSFVAITLGTGVGGGVIIDRKIYSFDSRRRALYLRQRRLLGIIRVRYGAHSSDKGCYCRTSRKHNGKRRKGQRQNRIQRRKSRRQGRSRGC